MRLTAEQIYQKLIDEDKILTVKGQIRFHLGDVSIIVKQRDVVGNIIQEWLYGYLKAHNIDFSLNRNTQMPPDFYLNPDDKTKDLLEVKAFNYKASPGFDIADFNAFQQEVISSPHMLHAKYLIFGYDMTEEGDVVIKKLWLKNVWEICRPMQDWALNLQIKKGVVHKIRPAKWYGQKSKFMPFQSLEAFVSAIEECVYKNPTTRDKAISWKKNFIDSYYKFYGKKLNIPRWYEIENEYLIKKEKRNDLQ